LSFGLNVLQPRTQHEAPERLGDLELVDAVTGAEAIVQVNKLHGLDIKLTGALIAEYAHISPYHGDSRATVWVGRAENAAAADGLTRRMVESIGKGGAPFSNPRRITLGGYEVFQVDGPGGSHFFYHSGKQSEAVIWLSIEASEPLPVLEQAVRTF